MPIPPWLLRDEAYSPRPDRDAFIDRSIASLLRLLGALRRSTDSREPNGGNGAGHRSAARRGLVFDARTGLAAMLLFVLLVSLSRGTLFLLFAGTILLVVVSAQRAEVVRDVVKASLPAAAFAFAVMLPSAFWGNGPGAVRLTAKVLVCVACARLFSAVTDWRLIAGALAGFRVPDLFILVLDTTLRALSILGDLSLALLTALRLRSVGRNPEKRASLSGIAGTLFLRSRLMMEDMGAAMECRGFTGSYRAERPARLQPLDFLPLLAVGGLGALFFVTGA